MSKILLVAENLLFQYNEYTGVDSYGEPTYRRNFKILGPSVGSTAKDIADEYFNYLEKFRSTLSYLKNDATMHTVCAETTTMRAQLTFKAFEDIVMKNVRGWELIKAGTYIVDKQDFLSSIEINIVEPYQLYTKRDILQFVEKLIGHRDV